jgi:lysophospholipase L1-like esterase
MKKEWMLASVIMLLTLGLSLLLLRAFAPTLLGIPADLQMVRVSKEITPFFTNVFRREDLSSSDFIIKDPYTGVRAQPLYPNLEKMGPNDILGFRNRAVPNVVDIVVIGDSQTYGNNSPIQLNWPSQMIEALGKKQSITVYNMSVGGWGAVQYWDAAINATAFQPKLFIVAFYTGNDPLESFKMAYNYDIWKEFIPDPALSATDIPRVKYPPSASELWPIRFGDGVHTVFSPTLRAASNVDHPAAKAGYAIMAGIAEKIASMAQLKGIQVAFTIIPTKELVFERKIAADKLATQQVYDALVSAEKANIEFLKGRILKIEHATYIDVVNPLQEAAMGPKSLYPASSDGHPTELGYGVIASTIARELPVLIPNRIEGFAILNRGNRKYQPVLIREKGYWYFSGDSDKSLIEKNGWVINGAPLVTRRDLADLDYVGLITEVDPARFGPTKQ